MKEEGIGMEIASGRRIVTGNATVTVLTVTERGTVTGETAIVTGIETAIGAMTRRGRGTIVVLLQQLIVGLELLHPASKVFQTDLNRHAMGDPRKTARIA